MLYLDGARLVVEDFLSHRRHRINEHALILLRRFDRWRTPAEATAILRAYAPASVDRKSVV